MNSYAAIKGRTTLPLQTAMPKPAAPAELTDEEQQRIDETKAFILEHLREMVPILRAFIAEGFDVVGWRNIQNCRLLSESAPREETNARS